MKIKSENKFLKKYEEFFRESVFNAEFAVVKT